MSFWIREPKKNVKATDEQMLNQDSRNIRVFLFTVPSIY